VESTATTYRRDRQLTIALTHPRECQFAAAFRRIAQLLNVSSQFKLGALVTEVSHLVAVNLSVEAKLVMNALSTCTMVRLGWVGANTWSGSCRRT
jgi:N-acetylmuramic acid 6-phosphate (MurNAc-6-P) etherase